jgi:hypothetical protein
MMKAVTSVFRGSVCVAAALIAAGAVLHGTVAHASDQLSGIWTGSYHCDQGDTAITMALTVEDGGAAHGTFAFGNLPGRSNVTPGKYLIEGRYYERGDRLQMWPAGWIDKPPEYTQSGFVLTYVGRAHWLTGRVQWNYGSAAGASICSMIILQKVSS